MHAPIAEADNEDEDLLGINEPPPVLDLNPSSTKPAAETTLEADTTLAETQHDAKNTEDQAHSFNKKPTKRLSPLHVHVAKEESDDNYFTGMNSQQPSGATTTSHYPLSVPAKWGRKPSFFQDRKEGEHQIRHALGGQGMDSKPYSESERGDDAGKLQICSSRNLHRRAERSLSGNLDLQSGEVGSTITAKEMFLSEHPSQKCACEPTGRPEGIQYPSLGAKRIWRSSELTPESPSSTISSNLDGLTNVNLEDDHARKWETGNAFHHGLTIPQDKFRNGYQARNGKDVKSHPASPLRVYSRKFDRFRKLPSLQMLLRTRSLQKELIIQSSTNSSEDHQSHYDSYKSSKTFFNSFRCINPDITEPSRESKETDDDFDIESLSLQFPEIKALERHSETLEFYLQVHSISRRIWSWAWTVHFSNRSSCPPPVWMPIKLLWFCPPDKLERLYGLLWRTNLPLLSQERCTESEILYTASTLGIFENYAESTIKKDVIARVFAVTGSYAEADNFLEESTLQEIEPYFSFVPLAVEQKPDMTMLASAAFQAFELYYRQAEQNRAVSSINVFPLCEYLGNNFLSLEASSRGFTELICACVTRNFEECISAVEKILQGHGDAGYLDFRPQITRDDADLELLDEVWKHALEESDEPTPQGRNPIKHRRNKSVPSTESKAENGSLPFFTPTNGRKSGRVNMRNRGKKHGLKVSSSVVDSAKTTLYRLLEWAQLSNHLHPYEFGENNLRRINNLCRIPQGDNWFSWLPTALSDVDLGGATSNDKVCLFRGWLYRTVGKPGIDEIWHSIFAQKQSKQTFNHELFLKDEDVEKLDCASSEESSPISTRMRSSHSFLRCPNDSCKKVYKLMQAKGFSDDIISVLAPLIFENASPCLATGCENSYVYANNSQAEETTRLPQSSPASQKKNPGAFVHGGVKWVRCYCILQVDVHQLVSHLLHHVQGNVKEPAAFGSPRNLAGFIKENAVFESQLVYGDSPEDIYAGKYSEFELSQRSIEVCSIDYSFHRMIGPMLRQRMRREHACGTAKNLKKRVESFVSTCILNSENDFHNSRDDASSRTSERKSPSTWMLNSDPCNDWGCVFSVGILNRARSRRYFMAPNELMRATWIEALYRSVGYGIRNINSTSKALNWLQRFGEVVSSGIDLSVDDLTTPSSDQNVCYMPSRYSTSREIGLQLLFLCAQERLSIVFNEVIRQTTEICCLNQNEMESIRKFNKRRTAGSTPAWALNFPVFDVATASYGVLGGSVVDSLEDLVKIANFDFNSSGENIGFALRKMAFDQVNQIHEVWLDHEKIFPYLSAFSIGKVENSGNFSNNNSIMSERTMEMLRAVWLEMLCSKKSNSFSESYKSSDRVSEFICKWLSVSLSSSLADDAPKKALRLGNETWKLSKKNDRVPNVISSLFDEVFGSVTTSAAVHNKLSAIRPRQLSGTNGKDTSLDQIWKDLQRDSILLDGRLLTCNQYAPPMLLAVMCSRVYEVGKQMKLWSKDASAVGFVRRLFQQCARTVVSGDAYDAAYRFFSREDVILVPASNAAEPLSFDVIDPYEEACVVKETFDSLSGEAAALVDTQLDWWKNTVSPTSEKHHSHRSGAKHYAPTFDNPMDLFYSNPAIREQLNQHRRRRIFWADQYLLSRAGRQDFNNWWRIPSPGNRGLLVIFQCFSAFRMVDTSVSCFL